MLMAIEIMLNAANVNLVAFWRYGTHRPGRRPARRGDARHLRDHDRRGRGRRRIGLILLCYRRWHAADVDRYDSLSG